MRFPRSAEARAAPARRPVARRAARAALDSSSDGGSSSSKKSEIEDVFVSGAHRTANPLRRGRAQGAAKTPSQEFPGAMAKRGRYR